MSPQKPLISVLIDTFNYGQYVEEAIESAIAQDFPAGEREILVVDDGSTDDTADRVQKFGKAITYLRKPNGGQASAFNLGLRHAAGKYVALLDADDYWLPGKLSRVVEEFEKKPEVGMVYHAYCEWNASKGLFCDGRLPLVSGFLHADPDELLRYVLYPTSFLSFRRSVIDLLLPIPDELTIQADGFLSALAIFVAPIVAIPERLAVYRIHSANLFADGGKADARRRELRMLTRAVLIRAMRYFRTFYARRVFRILPIYYLWILIYVVIVAVGVYGMPGVLPVGRRDLTTVPIYVLFLQNMIYMPSPFQWKWFVVTWSLAVEEQFYLLAPIAIRWIPLRRLVWLLVAVICAAPILRFAVYSYLPRFSYLAGFAMPCRADALAFGILATVGWRQEAFRQMLKKRRDMAWGVSFIAFVVVVGLAPTFVRPAGIVTYTVGYSALAIFYTCILLLALSQTDSLLVRLLENRMLQYVGGISYCVYIVHLTINQWAHALLLHSQPEIYDMLGVGVTVLSALVTWAVAATSWKYLESPAIRRGHQFVY